MPYRILALDGGCIRGTVPTQFLMRLETALGCGIFDAFDYFAGTSTGGVIALHLAVNGATGRDCANLYTHENAAVLMNKSLWDHIAPLYLQPGPKYDGKGKARFMRKVFGKQRIQSARKPVLVTAYDIHQRQIVVFKSDGGDDARYNPPAAEVANCTTAAPAFFPAVKTSSDPPKWLVDGGLAANNPAMCALSEAFRNGHRPEDIRMLSIGTGLPNHNHEGRLNLGKASRRWGALEWLGNDLIDHIFGGSMGAVDYWCRQILGANFLRINGPLMEANDALDDISPENIDRLRRLGDSWFEANGQKVIDLLGR